MHYTPYEQSLLVSAWEKALKEQTPEDEVEMCLDILQSPPEEKQALKQLVDHALKMKTTGEWEVLGSEPENEHERDSWVCAGFATFASGEMIHFGAFFNDNDYLDHWDRQEMKRDMEIFEEEERLHLALAVPHDARKAANTIEEFNERFKARKGMGYGIASKADDLIVSGRIVSAGPDYMTALSDYGKVYIPKTFFGTIENIRENRWKSRDLYNRIVYGHQVDQDPDITGEWMCKIPMCVKVMGPHCTLPLRCKWIRSLVTGDTQ